MLVIFSQHVAIDVLSPNILASLGNATEDEERHFANAETLIWYAAREVRYEHRRPHVLHGYVSCASEEDPSRLQAMPGLEAKMRWR